MIQKYWKSILKYAGIVLIFLVIAYGFVPQVLGGKIVNQSDISGYVGMAHEANTWNSEHPEDRTAWTNSMFGGMPTTMLTGNPEGDWTQGIYNAFLFGKRPASYLFITLLGAFLLMLSFGINWVVAIGGAIAVAFCSYNMQIIQVGHNTKMMAIAWFPWVLAALIFTYRKALGLYDNKEDGGLLSKKNLIWIILGAALFGMAVNFQIKANHIQISYYLAIVIFCYAIALFIWLVSSSARRKKMVPFFVASFLMLFMGVAGIGANANKLIPSYRYSHHTMRGGSELAQGKDSGQEADSKSGNNSDAPTKSKGLDIDYATAWSYGWEELPNLLIPNYNGGSSAGAVDPSKSATIQLLKRYGQTNVNEIAKALPMYWGPQPFTAGPMYMGAITIFLFLLGLLVCKGVDRWWILAATIITVLLALGRHFMPFTELWYYHMPFYSKFRTVSMALVALQSIMPLLGFYALDKVLKGNVPSDEFKKKGLIALCITGGFALLCAIFPSIAGDFSGMSDSGFQDELVAVFKEDRRILLKSDALVAAGLIVATFALLMWAYTDTAKSADGGRLSGRRLIAGVSVCLLVLVNMTSVGKRYLNSSHFLQPREFNNQFAQRPVDKFILADNELNYRTLDLTVDVFNDSHPSYWHKNIGGYSPVKMQRYQDLIERHLTKEINSFILKAKDAATLENLNSSFPYLQVLSMLNCKYIILDGGAAPVVNPYAKGAVWLVNNAVLADSPEEEIGLLDKISADSTVVIGPDFKDIYGLVNGNVTASPKDSIYITSYAPNELRYHVKLSSDRTAVFSDVYYPDGWNLTVSSTSGDMPDKQPVLFRANWTLRGAMLPAGEYELKMRFEPQSYRVSSNLSRISSILMLLLILGSTAVIIWRSCREGRPSGKQ